MKKILDYLPLLTICLIFFGFSNLYFYYAEFKVDIYNYISNSEILLSFFPTLVLSSVILYSVAYQSIIDLVDKKEKKLASIPKEPSNSVHKSSKIKSILAIAPAIMFVFVCINLCLTLLLTKVFNFKPYDLQFLNVIVSVIFLIVLYYFTNFSKDRELIKNNMVLISIFLILYFVIQISTYRKLDAQKIKDGISEKSISFNYGTQKIKTSSTLLFVGQTQSTLFLYNRKDSTTILLNLNKIDSLIIK